MRRSYPTPEHFCMSYCKHGGTCERERGHAEKHDSGYCEWTDDEALSRDEKDAVMAERVPWFAPMGELIEDIVTAVDSDKTA